MSFLAFDLFIAVNPDISTRFSRFHTLTIDDCSTWFGISPLSNADLSPKNSIVPLDGTIFGPETKIVVNTMIVWKIFRQVSPLTAGICQVKQPIQNLAPINFIRSARSSFLLDKRFDKLPFRICKIAWIAFTVGLLAIFDIFSFRHDKLLLVWQCSLDHAADIMPLRSLSGLV